MREMLQAFFADIAGQAALAILLVAVVDFFLGVFAALRDKTFEWSAIDAWLRSTLWGRVMPIWTLLVAGFLANNIQFAGLPVITTVGVGAATLFVAATLASIAEKWGPNHGKQGVPTS